MENTWSRNIMNSSGWRKNLASLKPSVLYKAVHSTCSFFTLDILKHHFSTVVEDRFQETGLEGKKKRSQNDYFNIITRKNISL
jgi:hypothetical protein